MEEKVEVLMNWRCNQNCIFCSVGHKLLHGGIVSFEEVKKAILFAEKRKASILSFSGGEPTIRKDLFKAVEFAKDKGFETIEVQTNGRMLSNKDYLKKLIDSGVNRFLVSIHSIKPEIEDYMVMVKGACKEQLAGLENLAGFDVGVRLSTVITKFNYLDLEETVDFLSKYDLLSYHLDFVAPDGFALDAFDEIAPRLAEAAPFIEKAARIIDRKKIRPSLHNLFPCIISGFEDCMADLTPTATYLIGPDFRVNLEGNKDKYRVMGPECSKCKWSIICHGPYKRYVKVRGFSEFKPVPGKKVSLKDFRARDY